MVTGGNGFIGRNMVKYLKTVEPECEIIILDDYSTSEPDKLWEGMYGGVTCDFVDIGSIEHMTNITSKYKDIDTIYHFAAKARVQPSILNCKFYHDTNVSGLVNILEYAKKVGVRRLVNSSSSSVYGGAIYGANQESDELYPKSPYALQKKIGEEYCKMYSELYDVDTVSLRYFNVYGEGMYESGGYKLVMGHWIEAYRQGKSGIIYGNGYQKRDFTYVGDVVAANYKCGSSETNYRGRIYNVGNGNPVELMSLVDIFREELGMEFINDVSRYEPYVTHADNRRIKDEVGIEFNMDVKTWLRSYLREIK